MRQYWSFHGDKRRRGTHEVFWALWRWSAFGFVQPTGDTVARGGPADHELWRFTPEGLHWVLAGSFGAARVETRAYGSSLTAAGELRGLAVGDFSRGELDGQDDRYPLVVCGRAVKTGECAMRG